MPLRKQQVPAELFLSSPHLPPQRVCSQEAERWTMNPVRPGPPLNGKVNEGRTSDFNLGFASNLPLKATSGPSFTRRLNKSISLLHRL
jgi:hypothetical protein